MEILLVHCSFLWVKILCLDGFLVMSKFKTWFVQTREKTLHKVDCYCESMEQLSIKNKGENTWACKLKDTLEKSSSVGAPKMTLIQGRQWEIGLQIISKLLCWSLGRWVHTQHKKWHPKHTKSAKGGHHLARVEVSQDTTIIHNPILDPKCN